MKKYKAKTLDGTEVTVTDPVEIKQRTDLHFGQRVRAWDNEGRKQEGILLAVGLEKSHPYLVAHEGYFERGDYCRESFIHCEPIPEPKRKKGNR